MKRKGRQSTATEIINAKIEDVWNVVTDNENWQWRSDLERVEVLNNGNEFIEYGKQGSKIHFTITKKEKYKIYEFTMDSKYFNGQWRGDFIKLPEGKTKISFTESLTYNNLFFKIFSLLFINLKTFQDAYMRDLKKKLGAE
jgi:hypothetical protein